MSSHSLTPFNVKSFMGRKRDFDPFYDLRRELEKLFESESPSARRENFFSPAIDIKESGNNKFIITAELPGIEEKDVDVSLSNNILTIKGEKKLEKEEKEENYHVLERSYGSFSRSFTLPLDIHPDHVKAEFAKGVLTITLPKSQADQEKTKKIEIKTKE